MPPIEVGSARAIGAVSAGSGRKTVDHPATPAASATTASAPATPKPAVQTSTAISPGEPPVDTDRVAVIRKAVESGTYPVIPTRIADAMIAAGVLLQSAKP